MGYEVYDGRRGRDASGTTSTRSRPSRGHPSRSPSDTFYLDDEHAPAHAHLAGPDPRDGVAHAADLHGLARPRLPARHARRDALADLPPGRVPRRRPRTSRSPTSRAPCSTSSARCSAPSARCACGRATSRSPSRRSSSTSPASSATAPGCPVCKHSGWIEMGGAGVVDPDVFVNVGYDPDECVRLRVRARARADRDAAPRPPRPAPVLGERPARPRAVLMKVPVSWLREYVAFDLPLEELAPPARRSRAARSTASSGVGVPDVDGNLGRFRVGRVLEAGKHPNADRLQLCRSTWGRASRARSSAAPGTSAPARRSRSRCPGAAMPGRARARAAQAARRDLRRDDPLRARARARHRPRGDHACSPDGARAGDAARRRAAARRTTCSRSRPATTGPT